MVCGVSNEAESAAMGSQDVADEQQSYSLAFRLRGEEGSEEIPGYIGRDAASVVCDGERPTPSPSRNGGE